MTILTLAHHFHIHSHILCNHNHRVHFLLLFFVFWYILLDHSTFKVDEVFKKIFLPLKRWSHSVHTILYEAIQAITRNYSKPSLTPYSLSLSPLATLRTSAVAMAQWLLPSQTCSFPATPPPLHPYGDAVRNVSISLGERIDRKGY